MDAFWYFIAGGCFACGLAVILLLYRYFVSEKYLQAEHKLRSRLNEVSGLLKQESTNPRGFIGDGLGKMGVGGLLESLGVPKIATPIVEGFIDKILSDPEKMKAIGDRFGIDIGALLKAGGGESATVQKDGFE